ncbi:cysteine proteinase, partial [Delitschia confertaspora ATCC 74209]
WLNDNIINEYIKVLVEEEKAKVGWVKKDGDAPPVHAFGSQWWVTAQGGMNKVARWSRRVNLDGRKLLNANLVLFPVCSGAHWTLIAIRPRARTIQYLDSLSRNARGSEPKVETAKAWLKMELGAGYVEEEWRVETGGSCQQLNGSDCGVFTCMNALALIRGQEPKGSIEADNGMLEARRQIAATLLSGASNG